MFKERSIDQGSDIPSILESEEKATLLSDWIADTPQGSDRVERVLRSAADILSELCARHANVHFWAGISDQSLYIQLPSLAVTIRGNPVHTLQNDKNAGGHTPLSLEMANYLPPEQSGMLQRAIGPAADLYSLGVFLYRTLTGQNPIAANSLSELLLGQMTSTVPSLRSVGANIPACVDEFVLRLLRRDPLDRYQTASAALDDVKRILAWITSDQVSSLALGLTDVRKRLAEPSLAGREIWTCQFANKLKASAWDGRPWGIVSQPGQGKTRLMQEFAHQGFSQHWLVLRAYGSQAEQASPFETFESIFRDMEAQVVSNSTALISLRDKLAQNEETIRRLLPWLFPHSRSHDEAESAKLTGEQLRRAVELVLDAIDQQTLRTVILIDNLDCIDPISFDLLTAWIQNRKPVRNPSLMLVATSNSPGQVRACFGLNAQVDSLNPLSNEEVVQLLHSMTGKFPEEILTSIANASAGNPRLAISLLQGAIESSNVFFDEDRWIVRSQDSPQSAPSHSAIWTDQDSSQSTWRDGGEEQSLLAHCNPENGYGLHLEAAKHLLQDDLQRYYDLAFHFDAAGVGREAIRYALLAAEESHRRCANELAVQYYRMAQKWLPASSYGLRCQTAERLGEVYLFLGDYQSAEGAFQESLKYSAHTLETARLVGRLGDVAFERGYMKQASEYYCNGLSLSGIKVLNTTTSVLVDLSKQIFRHAWHRVLGVARQHEASPQQRLQWAFLNRLARTFWKSHLPLWAVQSHLRAMNDAEMYLDTSELGSCYSTHALGYAFLKRFRLACRYSSRSLNIYQEQRDQLGRGRALTSLAKIHLEAASFQAAIDTATEAIAILESVGDVREANRTRYHRACALYRTGRFREAIADAQRMHTLGVEMEDAQASGTSLDVWMRCAPCQVPGDVLTHQAQITRKDLQSHVQTQLAMALFHIQSQQWLEAEEILRQAIQQCTQARQWSTYTSPCLAWLATVLRFSASEIPRSKQRLFRSRIRKAKQACDQAVRAAKSSVADLPHAWRESALIQSLLGRIGRAVRRLKISIAHAKRLGSPMEEWRSLHALKQLLDEMGDSRWRWSRQNSLRLAWLSQHYSDSIRMREVATTATETLSLMDRFGTLLEDGRNIVRSLNHEDILQEGCLAAQHLLRGQMVRIYSRDYGGAWMIAKQIATGFDSAIAKNIGTQSQSLIEGILSQNGTCVVPWSEPNRLARGSLLSTPIRVRCQNVAYLVVGHAEISNLFGNEELQVAEFIATLMGAALENAEGFSQLQQWNATLEQNVAERTAAAEQRAQELAISNCALRATEEQLRDAIEIANAANQAKNRFLATMSHEIRTPLNGIIGMTRLAIANNPNPQQTSFLNGIQRSGDSLMRLLNDLLDFSKIEAGKMTVESIAYDPGEVLSDVIGLLSAPAWQKGIEVVAYMSSKVPRRLVGDPMRLRQVMLNLLGNAIKFTIKGYVEVRAELDPENRDRWLIRIIDTGIGIPEDKQSSVFDAFSQADNSTTRRFGGTGLGLAISTELISLMQGSIRVSSQPNSGSEFTIELPVQLPTSSSEDHSVPRPKRFAKQNILVIDPCEGARRCLENYLEDSGARVLAFESWFNQSNEELPELSWFHAVVVAGPDAPRLIEQATALGIPAWVAESPMEVLGKDAADSNQQDSTRVLVKPCFGSDWLNAIAERLNEQVVNSPTSTTITPGKKGSCVDSSESSLRILVAEDGIVNQCVLVGLLELSGHRAIVANNGVEACRIIEEQSFDLCLMDLDMPEMDGIEATMAIRSRGNCLPIYAMTAHHDQQHADRCKEAGMDGYLTKPINPSELQAILDGVANRNEADISAGL